MDEAGNKFRYIGKTWILVLLVSTFAISSSTEMVPSEQGYIVSGIHEEYLPQPIYYESFIPIIYEYQTPKWNKTEITFNNWYTCLTETAPYRYSCPVVFHMNQAMLNLHVDFEGLHPVSDTFETFPTESDNYFSKLTSSSEFCTKIRKHFQSIWTPLVEMEKYLEAISNCQWDSELEPFIERNISDYNYSVRLPFTKMENNFYHTFYRLITATETNGSASGTIRPLSTITGTPNGKLDLVASALLSNARTTLQSAILNVYYAEKNRWIHANSDCSSGLIPQSIVTRSKFQESLGRIQEVESFLHSHDLSINLRSISKYYSLPLTDCSHTSGDTLLVRILVPTIKKNRGKSLQLVHVHNIPFEYKGHLCQIQLQENSFGVNRVKKFPYIYEELSSSAYPTDCRPNELCKVSEYDLQPSNSEPCVSALISRNQTAVRSACAFQCKKIPAQQLKENPKVNRIHGNKYIVTGSPLSLKVKCKADTKEEVINIDSDQIGSHLITLPCDCLFSMNQGNNVFYGEGCSTFSADEKLSVVPIIPFHFGKVKPASNRNAPVSDQFYAENVPKNRLVNLADFIDFSRVNTYLKFTNSDGFLATNKINGGGSGFSDGITHDSDGGAERLTYSNDSTSVSVLWVFFVITTIILFSLQIYILILLRKSQRVSYPKDDQILYKVPDSPLMY